MATDSEELEVIVANDIHVTQPTTSTNPFDDLDDEASIEKGQVIGADIESTFHRSASPDNPFRRIGIDEMDEHWRDLSDLMQSSITNPFSLQEFREHLTMIQDIMEKEQTHSVSNGRTSECLELLLSENILEKIYLFTTRQRTYSTDVRLTLLHFFRTLLSLPGPPLFIHQQVLRPLTRFLRVCEMSQDQNLVGGFIPLLHQICVLIQDNESLLDLFFTDGAGQVPSKFLVFTHLVPYIHDLSESGTRARDAMLLCLSIAGRSPQSSLCDFIVADTDFCQVLATGLSAIYSSLPTSVELSDDEWYSPLSELEMAVPQLKKFMQALSFCNSVLQMAPLLVCQAVVSLVKCGFLQQVLGPAILQNSPDEATIAIGYLCLFLLNISNVQLMRVFLQFITVGICDNKPVINSLIQNIASDSIKLSAMTLELFHILLNFNCEDFLLHVVLQYLLPGHHIMTNQLAIIGNRDIYCTAARKFLQLIPVCCSRAEQLYLESIANLGTSPQSSRAASPPLYASPLRQDSLTSVPVASTDSSSPSTGHGRVRRASTSSTCSINSTTSSSGGVLPSASFLQPSVPASSTLVCSLSAIGENVFEYISTEQSYYNYLMESRVAIEECAKACQCWSSTYDRCIVSEEREAELPASVKSHKPEVIIDLIDANITLSKPLVLKHIHNEVPANGMTQGELTVSSEQLTPSPNISPSVSPRNKRRSIRRLLDPTTSGDRFNDVTGLFLKILIEKLSQLLHNTPLINQLLMKVISRLAHYPQPLLRSVLLNHQLVLKPGVPNLLYVLQDLKQTIDRLARERENFEHRLGRARKTMIFKAAVKNGQIDEGTAARIESQLQVSRSESRLSDYSDPPDVLTHAKDDRKKEEEGTGLGPPMPRRRAMTEGYKSLSDSKRKRKKNKVTINMVYAMIMFGEFLKELAALSQEHSVLSPELLCIAKEI